MSCKLFSCVKSIRSVHGYHKSLNLSASLILWQINPTPFKQQANLDKFFFLRLFQLIFDGVHNNLNSWLGFNPKPTTDDHNWGTMVTLHCQCPVGTDNEEHSLLWNVKPFLTIQTILEYIHSIEGRLLSAFCLQSSDNLAYLIVIESQVTSTGRAF